MRQLFDICSYFAQSLLAQPCLLCQARSPRLALCDACRSELPWQPPAACPVCALPTPLGEVCGDCLRRPPAFDRTRAALQYRFPADALLQRYKYAGELALAAAFAELLRPAGTAGDLIIPMPLHRTRLAERGFNQALEIARVLSRALGIPLDAHACARVRATRPQHELALPERRRNLRGAFACRRDLRGRRVILLDDVMTSGASLDALAGVVKRAGAATVECWVVARTPRA